MWHVWAKWLLCVTLPVIAAGDLIGLMALPSLARSPSDVSLAGMWDGEWVGLKPDHFPDAPRPAPQLMAYERAEVAPGTAGSVPLVEVVAPAASHNHAGDGAAAEQVPSLLPIRQVHLRI